MTLPPAQDPNQKLSVVFVMDYSQSVVDGFRVEMESSVIAFIEEMNDGDQAAVVKFNDTNPLRASVVAPFTAIDSVAGNPTLDYSGSVGLRGRRHQHAGCSRSCREPHAHSAGCPSRRAQGNNLDFRWSAITGPRSRPATCSSSRARTAFRSSPSASAKNWAFRRRTADDGPGLRNRRRLPSRTDRARDRGCLRVRSLRA